MVLRQTYGICAIAFHQIDAPVNGTQIDIESSNQTLFAHNPVNGTPNHLALLDGWAPIDGVIVGLGLVLFGEQVSYGIAPLFT